MPAQKDSTRGKQTSQCNSPVTRSGHLRPALPTGPRAPWPAASSGRSAGSSRPSPSRRGPRGRPGGRASLSACGPKGGSGVWGSGGRLKRNGAWWRNPETRSSQGRKQGGGRVGSGSKISNENGGGSSWDQDVPKLLPLCTYQG